MVISEDKDMFILDDEEELDGTELVVVKTEMYRVTWKCKPKRAF